MASKPWMQFWVDDWLCEPSLRLVSDGARALWIDLLCYMHNRTDERGVLKMSGRALEAPQIAALVGRPEERVTEYLDELQSAGVCSFSEDAISCRRMMREEEYLQTRSECGKKGGRPKGRQNSNAYDIKAKQKLGVEKRKSKTKAPSVSVSVSVSSSEEGSKGDAPAEVISYYKTKHPRARPGEKEKKLVRARLADGFSAEDLKQAIDGNHASDFHQGKNDRGKKYNTLELIMRDASKVQSFIENHTKPGSNGPDWYKPEEWEQ